MDENEFNFFDAAAANLKSCELSISAYKQKFLSLLPACLESVQSGRPIYLIYHIIF